MFICTSTHTNSYTLTHKQLAVCRSYSSGAQCGWSDLLNLDFPAFPSQTRTPAPNAAYACHTNLLVLRNTMIVLAGTRTFHGAGIQMRRRCTRKDRSTGVCVTVHSTVFVLSPTLHKNARFVLAKSALYYSEFAHFASETTCTQTFLSTHRVSTTSCCNDVGNRYSSRHVLVSCFQHRSSHVFDNRIVVTC